MQISIIELANDHRTGTAIAGSASFFSATLAKLVPEIVKYRRAGAHIRYTMLFIIQ